MGTTRIKVVDLSSDNQQIKTSRKHAQKLRTKIEEKQEVKSQEEAVEPKAAQELKPEPKTVSSTKKKTKKTRRLGKNYLKAQSKIDKTKIYPADEALQLLEETSYAKFDPAVEIHLNVTDKNVRAQVNFPHSIGKKKAKRYLVFAEKFKSENQNVLVGNQNSVSEIENGKLKPGRDFDVVLSSPAFMPLLVKIAKILGPSGMMPNPKNGTITQNPQGVIENTSSSSYDFRSDPTAPIIHAKLGKLSNKKDHLKDNLKTLIIAIGPSKIRDATLNTTMGPGIKIDFTQFN